MFRKLQGVCQLCSKVSVKKFKKVQGVGVQFNKKNSMIFFKDSDQERDSCENTEELFLLKAKCYCHATYVFQSKSTLYGCLNVEKVLARNRRDI